MKRVMFDSEGRLMKIDGQLLDYPVEQGIEEAGNEFAAPGIFDNSSWSLLSGEDKLEPLKFSNGKTQEDIVKEVSDLIKKGRKVIFIHGVCGTGKSAIALNIIRELGRGSIVVPVKGLQRQYEEDYMHKKQVFRKDGRKMKIAMITGRENHDSIIKPGISCADQFLPDTIRITEKNYSQLREYYLKNPLIKNKVEPDLKKIKRISVAPTNPYWSPIIPAEYEAPLRDARKKKYKGLNGREFIFYHRKQGCSYYDQYQAYIDADVIIYNSQKYKIEVALDRKPETEVDIIDEADEFLDNFSTQEELNLTRLGNSLKSLVLENLGTQAVVDKIRELIELEEKKARALGINEDIVVSLKDTNVIKILELFMKNPELEVELSLDELSYANKGIEVARELKDSLGDAYLIYRQDEKDLVVQLVTTNLSGKFHEIIQKNKALVMMSGTLHSKNVLRNIYGINDFEVVEAETLQHGAIDIHRTGKEFDCRYSNFKSNKHTRKEYLEALSSCISKANKPILVHVNAFEDLPNEKELEDYDIPNLMSREKLSRLQAEDKTGRMISLFKAKMSDVLFTTKCSRGVDFPGDICRSVIFTKYPNPNVNGMFWKLLQKTHADYFWDFYQDKAGREFLQRIFRAVRSKDDHVHVLSPDIRVLNAVRDLQLKSKR